MILKIFSSGLLFVCLFGQTHEVNAYDAWQKAYNDPFNTAPVNEMTTKDNGNAALDVDNERDEGAVDDRYWLSEDVEGESSPVTLVYALKSLVPRHSIVVVGDVDLNTKVTWLAGSITGALSQVVGQVNASYELVNGDSIVVRQRHADTPSIYQKDAAITEDAYERSQDKAYSSNPDLLAKIPVDYAMAKELMTKYVPPKKKIGVYMGAESLAGSSNFSATPHAGYVMGEMDSSDEGVSMVNSPKIWLNNGGEPIEYLDEMQPIIDELQAQAEPFQEKTVVMDKKPRKRKLKRSSPQRTQTLNPCE